MELSATNLLIGLWGITAALSLYALFALPRLVEERSGRIVLLVALLALPLATMAGGVREGLQHSASRSACLNCHEMEIYGQSLLIDDDEAIPALHFQNNLIPRDKPCYVCHADYGVFGDAKAKLRGLQHVYAHYVRGAPETIELYSPYPNQNCLGCHQGGRAFEEQRQHRRGEVSLEKLYAGEVSCMSSGCHDLVHAVDEMRAGDFDYWRPDESAYPDIPPIQFEKAEESDEDLPDWMRDLGDDE